MNILYSISASLAGHVEVGCAVYSKKITMIRGEKNDQVEVGAVYSKDNHD